jgi:hypothetical protein
VSGSGGPSLVAAGSLASRRHRPARQAPATQQLIDRRKTMSKHTRALVLATIVAAMNLAGLTAIAQAQPPDAVEQFRRGERASQEDSTPADAVERFRQSERASQEQPATAEAVEEFRRGERASQQQPTIADSRRPPTEAQVGESWRHPGNVRVRPPEPSGQPEWLIPAIGVLAAILALVAGLVVMAAKRVGRRVRAGQAA